MPCVPSDMGELAQEWLRLDRDEVTRFEIERLLTEQNLPALEERLATSEYRDEQTCGSIEYFSHIVYIFR